MKHICSLIILILALHVDIMLFVQNADITMLNSISGKVVSEDTNVESADAGPVQLLLAPV